MPVILAKRAANTAAGYDSDHLQMFRADQRSFALTCLTLNITLILLLAPIVPTLASYDARRKCGPGYLGEHCELPLATTDQVEGARLATRRGVVRPDR
jgi:hypothetical protein